MFMKNKQNTQTFVFALTDLAQAKVSYMLSKCCATELCPQSKKDLWLSLLKVLVLDSLTDNFFKLNFFIVIGTRK